MSDEIAGTIGLVLLLAGIVAILAELVIMAFRAYRLERKVANLRGLITLETGLMMIDLAHLNRLNQERENLLLPFRRLQRMLGHPLTRLVLAHLRRGLVSAS